MLVYLQMMDSPADESKFEKIYYHYREYTYVYVFDILKNAEDADDVVQHTFMIVAQNINKIKNPISPLTQGFIITIAKNKAYDLYRAKTAHPNVAFNDEITLVGSHSEDFDFAEDVRFYLRKLPPQYKDVLVLKNVYGLTNWEVAKALSLSYANVIKIDQRAKKKFREIYKEGERT